MKKKNRLRENYLGSRGGLEAVEVFSRSQVILNVDSSIWEEDTSLENIRLTDFGIQWVI